MNEIHEDPSIRLPEMELPKQYGIEKQLRAEKCDMARLPEIIPDLINKLDMLEREIYLLHGRIEKIEEETVEGDFEPVKEVV